MIAAPFRSVDAPRARAVAHAMALAATGHARFDRLARLGARLAQAPVGLVSLVAETGDCWIGVSGAPEPHASARGLGPEGGRTLCEHVVGTGEPLCVGDLETEPALRAYDAPRRLGVRAYVGVPVRDPGGMVLGTLCVLDVAPRTWEPGVVDDLRELAHAVGMLLGVRADVEEHAERAERLARREREFVTLAEHAPDVIARFDRELRHVYVNGTTERETGIPVSAWLGRTHAQLGLPAPLVASWERHLRAVFASGDPGELSFQFPTPDGIRAYEIRLAPEFAPEASAGDGTHRNVEYVLAVGRNVTAQREAESALRESEARYRALVEALPAVVYRVSAEPPYAPSYVSPGIAALGYDSREWLELPDRWLRSLHPDDRPRVLAETAAACAAGRPTDYEYRLLAKDGSVRWFHDRGEFAPTTEAESGTPRAWHGVMLDITARKSAEAALGQLEARLQLALSAANMVVWERDLRTDALTDGAPPPDAAALVAASAFGSYQAFLHTVHPEDRVAVEEANERAVAGAALDIQFRYVLPDGSTRWQHALGGVLRDSAGRPCRLAGVTLDITERKQLEGELRQAQKMEAIGKLAGGIAHDFNNLLTVIGGHADFLIEALGPATTEHADATEIRRAADRAATLTRQLLAFSRKQLLQPRVLDLNEVVSGAERMLRRVIGEDIAIVTRLAPDLAAISADPGQLEQVLMNLSVNARDAMPDGGVLTVETASETVARGGMGTSPEVPAGRYVRLTVRDTGTGMDAATRARVFEPFFTTKAPGQGTGLGLATVFGIVAQSGGHVGVESTAGYGAAFHVYLPVLPESRKAEPQVVSVAAPVVRSAGTVLLVEDGDAVRALARRGLERAGYQVLEAAHGADAIRIAEAHQAAGGPLDLLVTDLVMPGISGRVLAERLASARAARRQPPLPVLFMSGYTDDEILRRGLLDTGMRLLEKPFTPVELARVAADVQRGAARTSAAPNPAR